MNDCRFIGRMGNDPEIKYTSNGGIRAFFSIAVKRYFIDDSKERKEYTDWINIIAWGNLAEAVGNVLRKGDLISVNCRYSVRSYEDKLGVKKYVNEFIATSISLSVFDIQKKLNNLTGSFTQFGEAKDDNIEEIPF